MLRCINKTFVPAEELRNYASGPTQSMLDLLCSAPSCFERAHWQESDRGFRLNSSNELRVLLALGLGKLSTENSSVIPSADYFVSFRVELDI